MSFARRICITGCNRGIGLEFVKQLASSTSPDCTRKIMACCRNPESAAELKTLAENHKNIIVLPLDVEKDESISKLAVEVSKCCGSEGLDLLINNAGFYDRSDTDINNVTREGILKHFDINVASQLMVSKCLISSLQTGLGNSLMVNITSKMGSVSDASIGSFGYRMSKTSVNMFSKVLSNELRDTKVSVIALHPGWVRTDMGGHNGILSVEESVRAMLKTISNLPESCNGAFLSYDGTTIPY